MAIGVEPAADAGGRNREAPARAVEVMEDLMLRRLRGRRTRNQKLIFEDN